MAGDDAGGRAKRADARRNVAAILDAGVECLRRDPSASLTTIAARAGVGRITLYGHFHSRAELVAAVLDEVVARADAALGRIDLSGDPPDALARLVVSSWRIVDQSRGVLRAAMDELPNERVLTAHERVVARIGALLERGRDSGAFRQDLPVEWLVTVAVSLMHAAADEVQAGRLDADHAGDYLVATLGAAFATSGKVDG